MVGKWQKIILMMLITIGIFIVSFCDFNGVYFALTVPLLIALFSYKNSYFLFGCLGMICASFVINKNAIIIVNISVLLFYLLTIILKQLKIHVKQLLPILGGFLGLSFSLFSFIILHTSLLNVLLISGLSYFLSYVIVDIQIDLKNKEKFSFTRKQLMFYGFFLNIIFYRFDLMNFNVRINIILLLLLNYILIKADPFVGMVSYLGCIIFNLQHSNNAEILFSLIPLIFIFKQVNQNKYLGAMIYLATNLFFIVYLNARDYLIEIIIVTLVMLVIPKKFFYYIRKLIIDPKDYQIKRYQENYYHSLQKNLRIQKIITYLQDKIKNNPRMRKSSKEIILSNMNFLNNKLKEEENDDYKETIIARLNNHDIETISLKICSDFLNSYSVFIETSKSEEEAIKNILEDILNVRLKREKKYTHKLINSYRYVFVNEEKINFNLAIKQRSKETNSCGDSYLKFYTKNKKYLLISDGMGHGKKASKDSSEALHLLENFIELGMSPKDAIVSCNALIYDKNKEIFNTLDLLEYDCFNNKAYLYKNGSGVTYLKNSESVEKIISENLPLGIVENIKVDKLTLDIDSGYIILTSDGVKKDLTEMLKNMNDKKANLVSNEILNYEGEKVEDDQTIVVINVIKKEGV